MDNFEKRDRQETIPKHEKREAFDIAQWKLSHETTQKTLALLENQEIKERAQENPEQEMERNFASLSVDEQSESVTEKDVRSAESLIAEIEAKYPELRTFADEQYA